MVWFWGASHNANPATLRGSSLAWKLCQPCRTFRVLGQKSAEMPQGEMGSFDATKRAPGCCKGFVGDGIFYPVMWPGIMIHPL